MLLVQQIERIPKRVVQYDDRQVRPQRFARQVNLRPRPANLDRTLALDPGRNPRPLG
jgi:hypothetical protein